MLLEIVVGSAIILSFFIGVMYVFGQMTRLSTFNLESLQASFLLTEGVEAVKTIRDLGWQSNIAPLTSGTDHFLIFDSVNNTWLTTTDNLYIDNKFERRFTLDDVYRDGNQDIAGSGTLDPETKKLSVSVAWSNHGATTTKSISTYLTDLFDN